MSQRCRQWTNINTTTGQHFSFGAVNRDAQRFSGYWIYERKIGWHFIFGWKIRSIAFIFSWIINFIISCWCILAQNIWSVIIFIIIIISIAWYPADMQIRTLYSDIIIIVLIILKSKSSLDEQWKGHSSKFKRKFWQTVRRFYFNCVYVRYIFGNKTININFSLTIVYGSKISTSGTTLAHRPPGWWHRPDAVSMLGHLSQHWHGVVAASLSTERESLQLKSCHHVSLLGFHHLYFSHRDHRCIISRRGQPHKHYTSEILRDKS